MHRLCDSQSYQLQTWFSVQLTKRVVCPGVSWGRDSGAFSAFILSSAGSTFFWRVKGSSSFHILKRFSNSLAKRLGENYCGLETPENLPSTHHMPLHHGLWLKGHSWWETAPGIICPASRQVSRMLSGGRRWVPLRFAPNFGPATVQCLLAPSPSAK